MRKKNRKKLEESEEISNSEPYDYSEEEEIKKSILKEELEDSELSYEEKQKRIRQLVDYKSEELGLR